MTRVQRVIDEGVSFYEHQIERDDGVTLFRGHARFVDAHRIESDGQTVEFEHALIATGARPRVPDLPGLDRVPFATSDDLLRARELPRHLVCVGAGAVALEFAQIYRRLGVEVTVIQRGPQIATLEDAELAGLLQRYLEEEGVRVLTGTQLERFELATGALRTPHVVAEATMTLAAPKTGLAGTDSADAVGRLFLADISVPGLVYERLGLRWQTPFARGPIVELDVRIQH